jgi:hypothetical protein
LAPYRIFPALGRADLQFLGSLQRRQHFCAIQAQREDSYGAEAKIRAWELNWRGCASPKQPFYGRRLEDGVRTAQGERRACSSPPDEVFGMDRLLSSHYHSWFFTGTFPNP